MKRRFPITLEFEVDVDAYSDEYHDTILPGQRNEYLESIKDDMEQAAVESIRLHTSHLPIHVVAKPRRDYLR